MVNEACCYPKACLRGDYQFDADREIETLLMLITIDSSEYQLRTRAPAALLSNITEIPPPARFIRKKSSSAMKNHGQARSSTTLASSDKPASAHQREYAGSAEFDRIFEALLLDADYPDALSSTLPLNS
jgi:hypothetical protein